MLGLSLILMFSLCLVSFSLSRDFPFNSCLALSSSLSNLRHRLSLMLSHSYSPCLSISLDFTFTERIPML